jgi:ABC-type multidrug transport system fused ATPase/permease subunit
MEDDKNKTRISLKRIWRMIRPSVRSIWYWYPLMCFLSVMMAVISVAEPYIYGNVVDILIRSVSVKRAAGETLVILWPFMLWWGVLLVAELVGSGAWNYLRWFIGNKLSTDFAVRLYTRMLELDVRRFQSEKGGEILRRFSNAWDALHALNNNLVSEYLNASARFILATGLGLWIDWRLTLVALIPVPINIVIGLVQIRVSEKDQHQANKLWDEATGMAGDAFDNITSMKAFRGEARSVSLLEKVANQARSFQTQVNKKWALIEMISGPTYVLGRLAIFFVGGYFVLNGTATVGTLIIFLGFVSSIYGSVQQIMNALPEFIRNSVRMMRAADYREEIPEIRNKPDALKVKRLLGDVNIEHVSYRYRDGGLVLKDVDVHIPAGKTFALVGESGAGKSTLAQMLMRFHDPKSGRIVIDGHDIRDLTLDSLRSNIGFVMQENLLFHDTIYNNLKFAKPSASEKEIIEAAKRAQAHDFIKNLKNGYKTVVGERGVKLSGGEKQRVALARVLLADPPILVLDEATSALDSKTEHALQAALHEVMQDRTAIVIAHRLSTVMQADRILVMDKGRIVDQGKHEELITRSGLYKQYWEIQAGGYV